MKIRSLWLSSLLLAAATYAAQAPDSSPLVVHEWGTFLSMSDSDGVTLDGMYHEEHALPAFVHTRSKDQSHLPSALIKGETPVIYFYTSQAQDVRVTVRFPQGIWTQWYPQASLVGPEVAQLGSPFDPRGGRITWNAELLPDRGRRPSPELPPTADGALWKYARDVDAAYVQTTDATRAGESHEAERFLFYRGLGRATLPLRATTENGGTLSLDAASPEGVRHLFILRVENGKGAYKYVPELAPGAHVTGVIPSMQEARPLPAFTGTISDDLAGKLTECGLYPKEARAMVNTWSQSYFGTDGIRVLYVLPQAWTDRFIPMTISPAPGAIVRVMVGRTELLTPERARQVENAVRDLAAPDSAARERAFTYLREQGRYVEPILRRTLRTSADTQVQTLCKRLLLTDFVTELRAAIHSADNGAHLQDSPLHLHAQLAALLREIGLNAEAKAEAAPVLSALRTLPAPPMDENNTRHYLRAYARAWEAMGDDRNAAEWYGKFIRFGSHAPSCGTCHDGSATPRSLTWFHDWWVGQKFAAYTLRAGQADAMISQLQKQPNDTAAKMMLAYLYEARGEPSKAAREWAMVGASGETASR